MCCHTSYWFTWVREVTGIQEPTYAIKSFQKSPVPCFAINQSDSSPWPVHQDFPPRAYCRWGEWSSRVMEDSLFLLRQWPRADIFVPPLGLMVLATKLRNDTINLQHSSCYTDRQNKWGGGCGTSLWIRQVPQPLWVSVLHAWRGSKEGFLAEWVCWMEACAANSDVVEQCALLALLPAKAAGHCS